MSKQRLLSSTALSLILAMAAGASVARADSLPAVSKPNGKIAVEGGVTDDDFSGFLTGAFSTPINHSYGMQIDGMIGSQNSNVMAGAALHLFWRDPARALVGLYAGWTHQKFDFWVPVPGQLAFLPPVHVVDSIDRGRIGGEVEIYRGRLSLEAIAGVEFGEGDSQFFSMEDLRYYVNDDFAISVGHRYVSRQHTGVATVEYQVQGDGIGSGLTLFADGRVGENNFDSIRGGVRVYFGAEPKSLIRRHREDDPHVKLPDGLVGEGACAPSFVEGGVFTQQFNVISADSVGNFEVGCNETIYTGNPTD